MKKILVKTLFIMLVAIGNVMAQTLEESLAIAYENNNMLKSKMFVHLMMNFDLFN